MKNDEIDAAILKAIKDGNTKFGQIWALLVTWDPSRPRTRIYRVIDQRLQVLRKQHKITYYGGRWSVL